MGLAWALPAALIGWVAGTALQLQQADLWSAAVYVGLGTLGACLGVGGSLFAWPRLAVWGAKPLVAAAAAASYSFYLLHQPILGYGADMLRSIHPFAAMCLLCAVSLPASYWLSRWQDRIVAGFEAKAKGKG